MAKNKNLFIILSVFGWVVLSSFNSDPIRDSLKHVYDTEVGVREKTGHNDGTRVEQYLRYCNLDRGNPWCASFVCWCLAQAKIINPRSGYCPDLFTTGRISYRRSAKSRSEMPKRGDVWGLYFPEKSRVAHVGFVDDWQDKYVITVEGNTNDAGSREGDGVYRKRRLISSIYIVADYIDTK